MKIDGGSNAVSTISVRMRKHHSFRVLRVVPLFSYNQYALHIVFKTIKLCWVIFIIPNSN